MMRCVVVCLLAIGSSCVSQGHRLYPPQFPSRVYAVDVVLPESSSGVTVPVLASAFSHYSAVVGLNFLNSAERSHRANLFRDTFEEAVRARGAATSEAQKRNIGITSLSHLAADEVNQFFGFVPAPTPADSLTFLNKELSATETNAVPQTKRRRLSGSLPFDETPERSAARKKLQAAERTLNYSSTEWPVDMVHHPDCLTPIRTQHEPGHPGCGSCWSHATVGALEIGLCMAKQRTTPTENDQHSSGAYADDGSHATPLAVQEIIDCLSVNNIGDPKLDGTADNEPDNFNHGCQGGEYIISWNMIMGRGLRSAADFGGEGDSYDADAVRRCAYLEASKPPTLFPRWSLGQPRLTDYLIYPNVEEMIWPQDYPSSSLWPMELETFYEYIKQGVRQHGGVAVQILTKPPNFKLWTNQSDLYYPDIEECIGTTDPNTGLLKNVTNHEVVVTGYGRTEDDRRYFKIKNSWGTTFADDGYFKIAVDHCKQYTSVLGPGTYLKAAGIPLFDVPETWKDAFQKNAH